MNISVEKQQNCTATLRVEIPSETVQTERNNIVSSYATQARIQGFRPGKAPKKVVEKRFAEQISEELEDRLTRKAFDEALKTQDIKVLDFGRPSGFSTSGDGAIAFEAVLTLAPDIALPEYKGLTINAPSAEITEEELDQQLQVLRERSAEYNDVADRPAQNGDIAVIDYTGTVDGQPIEEVIGRPVGYIAGREGFWMKLDEESFLPGFAAQLEGANKGDQRTAKVTVPDDFPVSELHGKELTFEVTVQEIKEATLPELDDAFATKITGGQGLDQLKEMLRQRMGYEKQRQIDDMKVNQIVEHFNSAVDFELPDNLLRQETQSQADSLVQRGAQSGMSEEELSAQREEIFATAGMQARTNLKTNFILQEIARAENLTVGDQELISHLAQIASSRKENPKKFIKQLQREGRIPGIRNSMLVGKAIDFVLEHATVEEIPAETPETSEA